jgi:hypothetical protein
MRIEKVSAFAEIISAVAIVVTLAYLTVQTRQNTVAVQAATRQAMLKADQDMLLYMASNPEVEESYYKASLTDNEKRRLDTYLVAFMRVRESNWFQYKSGGIDERTWESYRRSTVSLLSRTARMRNWWYRTGAGFFDAEFKEEIDQML